MKLHCLMSFYNEEQMYHMLVFLHGNVIMSNNFLEIEFDYNPEMVYYDILTKFAFKEYSCYVSNIQDSFYTKMEKDINGNILYEARSDGFYEENTYTSKGKLVYCTTHYSNGLTECEQYVA